MFANLNLMNSHPGDTAGTDGRSAAVRRSMREARQPGLPDGTTDRLRQIVHGSGGTKRVAARAGVALSTLGSYLAGGEMKLSTAKQLCDACGVSLGWLIGESRTAHTEDRGAAETGELARIPYMRPASMPPAPGRGGGDRPSHVALCSTWMRAALDRPPEQLLALEAQGSAMEPTIHEGDLLLIDSGATGVASLEIHVIQLGGEYLVRRLERGLDGSIIVRTDNPRFAPQILAAGDGEALSILGRVVWKGSSMPL